MKYPIYITASASPPPGNTPNVESLTQVKHPILNPLSKPNLGALPVDSAICIEWKALLNLFVQCDVSARDLGGVEPTAVNSAVAKFLGEAAVSCSIENVEVPTGSVAHGNVRRNDQSVTRNKVAKLVIGLASPKMVMRQVASDLLEHFKIYYPSINFIEWVLSNMLDGDFSNNVRHDWDADQPTNTLSARNVGG